MFDIVVIGGGVIGGTILRELSKREGSFCLLEKNEDVAMGQSSANSGIVHAGFDAIPNTKKAKFNLLGNKMMKEYAEELGVKYVNNGSLVLGYNEDDREILNSLFERGERNGVKDLKIIEKEEIKRIEPNVNEKVTCALHAPTGALVCPYQLTIASIGNAMDNGAKLKCNFKVEKIEKLGDFFTIISSDGQKVEGKIIINCAGYYSDEISKMAGDNSFTIGARKGEYILLDRESGDFVNHTLFTTPSKAGKGVLVTKTVDNNILLGPTSVEIEDDDNSTTSVGLESIIEKTSLMCESVPLYNTITSFAGVRAYADKGDFIIEKSLVVDGLINCAGIESPGLTSAPAIAKYVVEELVESLIDLKPNKKFIGKREPYDFFKKLSIEGKNKFIAKDSRYGKIVCRCEQVTEGEIVNAIYKNPPARTVSAIKRRTRTGMGRCQSGFCQARVVEILSRELQVDMTKITLNGKDSAILVGKTK